MLIEAVVLGDDSPRHAETVRALVAAGADVNLPDQQGVTVLAHARRRGHDAVAAIRAAVGRWG